jgi:hypothetical protein
VKPRLILIQAAFNQLRPHLKGDGWVTCALLDAEMRTGFLPLYGNGELLTPTEIADLQLYVRVEVTPTGQFINCTVASHLPPRIRRYIEVDDRHPVQMVTVECMPPPKWEMDADAVEELVRQRGVHQGVHQRPWIVRADKEIEDLFHKHSKLLENHSALYRHIANLFRTEGIHLIKDRTRFRRNIRNLVSKYRGKP